MAAQTKVEIQVVTNTRALEKLKAQMMGLEKTTPKVANNIRGFNKAAKGLGASMQAALGPLLTVTAAIGAVGASLRIFQERQADVAVLSQGLQNLGLGADALDALQRSADKLGKTTLFNQEDFTQAYAALTSFRRIGVSSYERVAETAANVAQVMKTDVKSATIQLAKALEDPSKGLTALTRTGITFTDEQAAMIKGMQAAGDIAEAQKLILEELNTQYNETAKAAGSAGLAGALDSLGETLRDVGEKFGALISPAIQKYLTELTDWWVYLESEVFPEVVKQFEPVVAEFEKFATSVPWEKILNFSRAIFVETFKAASGAIAFVLEQFGRLTNKITALFLTDDPVAKFIRGSLNKMFDLFGASTDKVGELKKELEGADSGVGKLKDQLIVAEKSAAQLAQEYKEGTAALKAQAAEAAAVASVVASAAAEEFKRSQGILATEIQLNEIKLQSLQTDLKGAQTQAQREALAQQIYAIEKATAEAKYAAAIAEIQNSIRVAQLAYETAEAKQLQLEVERALAVQNQQNTDALDLAISKQQALVEISKAQLDTAAQLGDRQAMVAAKTLDAALKAAELARETNAASKSAEKLATSFNQVAGAASSAAQSARAVADARSGGGTTQLGFSNLTRAENQALAAEMQRASERKSGYAGFGSPADSARAREQAAIQERYKSPPSGTAGHAEPPAGRTAGATLADPGPRGSGTGQRRCFHHQHHQHRPGHAV